MSQPGRSLRPGFRLSAGVVVAGSGLAAGQLAGRKAGAFLVLQGQQQEFPCFMAKGVDKAKLAYIGVACLDDVLAGPRNGLHGQLRIYRGIQVSAVIFTVDGTHQPGYEVVMYAIMAEEVADFRGVVFNRYLVASDAVGQGRNEVPEFHAVLSSMLIMARVALDNDLPLCVT